MFQSPYEKVNALPILVKRGDVVSGSCGLELFVFDSPLLSHKYQALPTKLAPVIHNTEFTHAKSPPFYRVAAIISVFLFHVQNVAENVAIYKKQESLKSLQFSWRGVHQPREAISVT